MRVAERTGPKVISSEVEPRIVERRRTVLVERRRSRRRRAIVIGALVVVVAAPVAALFSPLADVDRLVVEGGDGLAPELVEDTIGIERGDQMIELDLVAARTALRSDPSIAAVAVTREWPDTVRVVVVPEVPSAVVRSSDGDVVVSTTGRVLGRGTSDTSGAVSLPVLELDERVEAEVGDDVAERVRTAVVAIERIPPDLRSELVQGHLDDAGSLALELDDGATVQFGPVDDLPAKIVAVQTVLAQVVRECMGALDVREPTRPAVTRRPDCDVPPATVTAATPGAGTDGEASGEGSDDGSSGAGAGDTTG